ncbi:MAG: SGNH/GDSL hydrolase family protein [Cytophagaceae bacterium]|nr:MAG: SGNH/GDSL hydrolase family protein [Cytophagaceae bacterium]
MSIAPLATQNTYVNVLKTMCTQRQRAFLDMYALSQSTTYMLQQGYQDTSDGCHPTPAGYHWIAQNILQVT